MTYTRKKATALWDEEAIRTDSISCSINHDHGRSRLRSTPLHLILPSNIVQDVLWTWFSECVITKRVADSLSKKGFTGFELKETAVSRVKRFHASHPAPPRLYEFKIKGWGGVASDSAGLEHKELCPSCGYRLYRMGPNPPDLGKLPQWDCSDFFIVWPLPRFVLVTERVREFFVRQKFSGVKFIPLSELLLEGEYSVGRLTDYIGGRRGKFLARKHQLQ